MHILKQNLDLLYASLFKPLQGNILILLVLATMSTVLMIRIYAGHTAPAVHLQTRISPCPEQPLDLNRASAEDLCLLPGIGMVRAGQIVKYRNHHGRFQAVEELRAISGIGPKTLKKLKPLLRINP